MKNNFDFQKSITLFCLLCFFGLTAFAQVDSSNVVKPPINIGDSTLTIDSLKTPPTHKEFFVSFNEKYKTKDFLTYSTTKKEIDRLDYKYTGDVLSYLPFSSIADLGHLGAPNEPNIYGFGFGNISLNIDNFLLNTRWNNNTDLNRVQSESIYKLKIEPIHKAFLFGNDNNLSAINIVTNDSLQQKPISRFRYYQASSDEGFVDASFGARVLPRLALSFRITNSSIDDNYFNSEFGTWKVNIKSIYKLMDSLYAKIDYHHLKLNTSLNGGVNVENLITNPLATENSIYNNQAPVLFEDQTNSTTSNLVLGSLYGNFIPTGYTELIFSYNKNVDVFKNYSSDSIDVKNENKYSTIAAKIIHNINFEEVSSQLTFGYESVNYDLEGIDFFETENNYFSTAIINYNLFNGLLKPSIFGKISEYNSQTNNGFGIDLKVQPLSQLSLLFGYSKFDRPYSIIEMPYIDKNINSDVNTIFASLEFNSKITTTSISYFNVESSNNAIPIFNNQDITLASTKIIFRGIENIKSSGVNINSRIHLWNLLIANNFSHYWLTENSMFPQNAKFNFTTGLYYVDTLFNSNLDLKTGFTFHLFDNLEYRLYDFQQMRSSSYYLDNSIIRPFEFYDVENDNFRMDFLLAGRIQDRATFYFIYENILGNNYFVIPYYPMPDGGIKIGISWDFLD